MPGYATMFSYNQIYNLQNYVSYTWVKNCHQDLSQHASVLNTKWNANCDTKHWHDYFNRFVKFHFKQQDHALILHNFSDTNTSRGSVAMQLTWNTIFNDCFIANFLDSDKINFQKSANIWQIFMTKTWSHTFWLTVYNNLVRCKQVQLSSACCNFTALQNAKSKLTLRLEKHSERHVHNICNISIKHCTIIHTLYCKMAKP